MLKTDGRADSAVRARARPLKNAAGAPERRSSELEVLQIAMFHCIVSFPVAAWVLIGMIVCDYML